MVIALIIVMAGFYARGFCGGGQNGVIGVGWKGGAGATDLILLPSASLHVARYADAVITSSRQ